MNLLTLAYLDSRFVCAVLAALMLAAWRIGCRIGKHIRNLEGEWAGSKFDDASVAVLGLLLAFTFSTSIGKFDQRRLMLVADSNAIGDFYTCASLLKEPARTKLQAVIRDYAKMRLNLARQRLDRKAFDDSLVQFQSMHGQMVDLVSQAVTDGTPIAVSLTNTLNGVTSNHAARLSAIRDRLPESIVILLFTAAIVSTLLIGREQGGTAKPDVIGTLCFILLVTCAVYVTLDLNQPERGLIRINQEPMERLLLSMTP
jgi:hypothetical protein